MTTTRAPPAAPVVVTASSGGVILGRTHAATDQYPRAVDAFYGLPYARVPARFRPAELVRPASFSRFDASRPGKGRQPAYGGGASSAAEKTLTLNIFRPSSRQAEDGKEKKLPVVVYIHGGGFNFGEPLERDHVSFVSWAEEENQVMVVSICYRLGALGFLPPSSSGDDGREANLGLKDQRLALSWIQDHVGAFGGDPDNVTALGLSAGAHSVGHHILDPRRQRRQQGESRAPLFRKAILESGAATARSVLAATHPRTQAQLTSLRGHAEGEKLGVVDVGDLLGANVAVWMENEAAVTWPFQPVVEDGTSSPESAVIPDTPLRLWEQFVEDYDGQDIAVITGFCSHEGTSFVPGRASTNAEFRAFFANLIPGFTTQDLDLLEALYPDPVADPTSSPYVNPERCLLTGKGAQFTRLHQAYAHYAYICPVLYTAHRLSSLAARHPTSNIKVYVYEFAALGGKLAASEHSSQSAVVARDTRQLHGRPGLTRVAEAMHARWTAFAASKDGGLPGDVWPVFEGDGEGRMLVFGRGNDERVVGGGGGGGGKRSEGVVVEERTWTEREKRQCEFWWERMEGSQGRGDMGRQRAGL